MQHSPLSYTPGEARDTPEKIRTRHARSIEKLHEAAGGDRLEDAGLEGARRQRRVLVAAVVVVSGIVSGVVSGVVVSHLLLN